MFLLIVKFTNNNTKNASINDLFFELNCNYYYYILYKKDINSHIWSKSINGLLGKFEKLMTICLKNL